MMPDLGKYAVEVLSAYATSLALLGALLWLTLRRGKAARAALKSIEAERQHSRAVTIYQTSMNILRSSLGRGR